MKLRFFLFVFIVKLNFFYCQTSKISCCKDYYLKAIFIGKQKNSLAQNKATINLNTKNKTAKCFTSCNFINLTYSSKKTNFKFITIKPDAQSCPDHLIGLESDLKENLPKITTLKVISKNLYFFNNTDTLMIFVHVDK